MKRSVYRIIQFAEKLIIPVLVAYITFVTANQSNQISKMQLSIIENQKEQQKKQFEKTIETKYIELFYSEINNPDPNAQKKAIAFLNLLKPELCRQMLNWIEDSNIELTNYAKSSYKKINEEMNIALSQNDSNLVLGLVNARRGEFEKAIEYYSEATKNDRDNKIAYNYLGYAYFRTKDYRQARKSFQKAIRLDENYAWARYNLALTYLKTDEVDKAFEQLQLAIESDADFVEIIKNDVQFIPFRKQKLYVQLLN